MFTYNKNKMKKDLPIYTYIIAFASILFGAFLKILHHSNADTFLMIGLIAQCIFILFVIGEVVLSFKIKTNEKVMWIVGAIFMSSIVGLIYLFSARKRIANPSS